MNKKIIIGLVLIILVTGCGCKKKEETKVKENKSVDVIKDQKTEVFEFVNTSLVYENGMSKLETAVTNTSDKTQKLKEFHIHFMDKNDNEIVTLVGYVGKSMAAHETKIINSYSSEDLTSAKNIKYEVIK